MSVQVDPMAASVVAAALSGTYPTLLPQWCLPPREAPLVGVQTHQDSAAAADQPLDLSAKPRNSQVSSRSLLPRGNARSFAASSLFLQRSFEFIRTLNSRQERCAIRQVFDEGSHNERRLYINNVQIIRNCYSYFLVDCHDTIIIYATIATSYIAEQ